MIALVVVRHCSPWLGRLLLIADSECLNKGHARRTLPIAQKFRGNDLNLVRPIFVVAVFCAANALGAEEKPKVLIIGDSISIGYTPLVQQLLSESCIVQRTPVNCRSSKFGVDHVKQWIAEGEWDVIHFNFGLWDWYGWGQDSKATVESYSKNLETIVKDLHVTGATLIFATTTPPCAEAEETSRVLVTNARARQFREAALKVMDANGVAVNDLYNKVLPDIAAHQKSPHDVHFKPAGIAALAEKVSASILEVLRQSAASGSDYERRIEPLLNKHCYRCHNGETREGNVRLDNVKLDFAKERELWDEVEKQISTNEMPPEAPFLTADNRLEITDWIKAQEKEVDWSAHRQAGQVTLPLLNRHEYENTVRALFNDNQPQADSTYFDFSKGLLDDGVGDTGFSSDRDSPSLAMTSARLEKYIEVTEEVLDYYLYTDERIRYEIEAEQMKATTAVLTPTANGIMIKANRDSLYTRWLYPRTGWYLINVKAWGERVDNRACAEMVIYLDRDEVGYARLLSTRSQPGDYRCLVWIEKGHHTLRFRPQRSGVTKAESLLPVPPPFPDKPVIADFNDLGLGTGVYMCVDRMTVQGPIKELPADFTRNESYSTNLILPPNRSIITQQNTPAFENSADTAWEKQNNLTINRKISNDQVGEKYTKVWVKPLGKTDFTAPPPVERLLVANGKGREAARQVISRFARKAFRRVVSEEDVTFFLDFYDSEVSTGGNHRAGLKSSLFAILISPDFFYRIPRSDGIIGERKLDSYEMASRLSYFLWNSAPDDELLALADAGKLTDPKIIDREVVRMLQSPQGQQMAGVFAREWLGYRELGVTIKPDEALYKSAYYDKGIEALFRKETEAFVAYIFSQNRPLEELITADYVFWNRALAEFYSVRNNELGEIFAASIHHMPDVDIQVPNGIYTIQLLLYEGWTPRSADIVIEGQTIRKSYNQLAAQGGTFRHGSVLRHSFTLTDENIDIEFKAQSAENLHLGGLILSRGKRGEAPSSSIVKSKLDLDLNNVVKAINFGDSKDLVVDEITFFAAAANTKVDGVTNKSQGDVYAGEFGQQLPTIVDNGLLEHLDDDLINKIQLPIGSNRGGLLGMGSILTVTSHPTRTSAVDRGLWVYEKLFGKRLPDPPVVPALEETANVAGVSQTFREILENHRSDQQCASCHKKIDPIGFGLENFDAIGRWRTIDRGQPIDSAGVLPDGQPFNGPGELRSKLIRDKSEFYNNMARTLLTYALGRRLEYFDQPEIEKIVQRLEETGGQSYELFKMVAKAYPFTHTTTKKETEVIK